MNILLAVDSFKGSFSSKEVEHLIARGIRSVFPDWNIVNLPVADGGEGTLESLKDALHGEYVECPVQDPLGRQIKAVYVRAPGPIAVIEMAQASGLPLVREQDRDPVRASTYGTGQLIADAIESGCGEILLAIGGSATTDGGMGALQALGAAFYDKQGNLLKGNGEAMGKAVRADVSKAITKLQNTKITILCDVQNPLFGKNGSAYVFAPQKGADAATVAYLDANLRRFDELMMQTTGRKSAQIPGAGAAGGLGYGLMHVCEAVIRSGIEAVLDQIGFDRYAQNADIVITGEGRIDSQTAYGKVPAGVAARAKQFGKPVFAIGGSVQGDIAKLYEVGIDEIVSAVWSVTDVNTAIAESATNIPLAVGRLCNLLKMGRELL